MVPPAQMRRLVAEAKNAKSVDVVEFPTARHMDAYDVAPEAYWSALQAFMEKYAKFAVWDQFETLFRFRAEFFTAHDIDASDNASEAYWSSLQTIMENHGEIRFLRHHFGFRQEVATYGQLLWVTVFVSVHGEIRFLGPSFGFRQEVATYGQLL
eukprot:gene12312-15476_t